MIPLRLFKSKQSAIILCKNCILYTLLPLFCLKTYILKILAVKTQIWRNFTCGLAASSQFHLAPLYTKFKKFHHHDCNIHGCFIIQLVWGAIQTTVSVKVSAIEIINGQRCQMKLRAGRQTESKIPPNLSFHRQIFKNKGF